MYLLHIDTSVIKLGIYRKGKNTIFAESDKLEGLYLESGIDYQKVADTFQQLASQTQTQKLKLPLCVIIEPRNIEAFLLVSSKETSANNVLEAQVEKRLGKEKLDSMYYSFQRIAPFVYQFLGIKKGYLENITSLANVLNLPLWNIIPWPLLLAKTNSDVSSIYLYKKGVAYTSVFSNLSGTTNISQHKELPSDSELKKLFKAENLYDNKDSDPIIYILPNELGKELISDHSKHAVVHVSLNQPGFEEIELVNWGLSELPSSAMANINLLSLVPTPEIVAKRPVVKYVMATAGLFLCTGLLLHVVTSNRVSQNTKLDQSNVLSEETKKIDESPQTTQSQTEVEEKVIKRSDLSIQVLNGNGVAGSAAKVQVYLEGFGYKINDLDNAEKSDFEKTLIRVKKESDTYKDLLVNDMKTNYDVEFAADLPDDAKYDAIITVGLK